MDIDLDVEDNELGYFAEQTFNQLQSAPSSTPNSVASSPPLANEDFSLPHHSAIPNPIAGQVGNSSSTINTLDDKSTNLKRGPGRPRKDLPTQMFNSSNSNNSGNKMQKKSKSTKDLQQLSSERGAGTPLLLPQLSSDNSNMGYSDDKPSPSLSLMEDLPYFAEKYPGKVCCLCNLGERSSLGQGDFLRVAATSSNGEEQEPEELANLIENEKLEGRDSLKVVEKGAHVVRGRIKNVSKNRFFPSNENINELDKIGQLDALPLRSLVDSGYFYVHRMCALWSTGLSHNVNDELPKLVEEIVEKSLKRKCKFCGQYGASVTCKMNCEKIYHLPCAAATGSFLIIENMTAFCPDHIHQVPFMCSNTNIDCRQCSTLGDLSKLIMCSTCGDHYHTTCIGLANYPDTRSGWNCQQCSKCQICRQVDSGEVRSIKCEHCQKVYHATCLRPMISSIPKYGWKCNRCRICTDCGSRTPGAGTSSRWHCHYTICDSCYQQRNKGFSCPICHKAYRAAAHKEMVKCSWCNRFVHSSCDEEADLSVYHKKKENNPDYDYYCPLCKLSAFGDKSQPSSQIRGLGDSSEVYSAQGIPTGDNQLKDTEMDYFEKNYIDYAIGGGSGVTVGEGRGLDVLKMSKKRMGFKMFPRNRGGKIMSQKPGVFTQFGRRRGGRGKSRHFMMMGGSSESINGTQAERGGNRCSEDDWNMEKKLVLFSAKDKYLLSQDMCVMCGSVGIDQDGCLIACSQCGQCYHPYCANIKISLVVLQKGWRCLDCTVCEGCGQKNDEACLILCDECDISYHTYCMNPPLDKVPHGNWKCKWCAICQKCGRNSPGRNCSWRNGFLECGPCASQRACCVCLQQYNDSELIIQCSHCKRWLHCQCDSISNEKEAQLCDYADYTCILCRPKNKPYPHPLLAAAKTGNLSFSARDSHSSSASASHLSLSDRSESGQERICALNGGNDAVDNNENTHCLDGVCVSERGLNAIKALALEIKRKRKMRPVNEAVNKDISGISATIESVVAGTSAGGHVEEEGGDDESNKPKNEIYKDGMIWPCSENSPPPGFSISTNDEGVNILRKKRQRNLQKLGIGGFSVRNRTLKKDCDDNPGNNDNPGTSETEKKKKMVRKKGKTKLIETYPAYLQEAFFGKILLEQKDVALSFCESDSSDELCQTTLALLGGQENSSASPNKKALPQEKVKAEPENNSPIMTIKPDPDILMPNLKTNNGLQSPMDTRRDNKLNSVVTMALQQQQSVPEEQKNTNTNFRVQKPPTIAVTTLLSEKLNDATDISNKTIFSVASQIPSGILSKPTSLDAKPNAIGQQLSVQNSEACASMPHGETLVTQHTLLQTQDVSHLLQPQPQQQQQQNQQHHNQLPHPPTHISMQLTDNLQHLKNQQQQQQNVLQPVVKESQAQLVPVKETVAKLYAKPTTIVEEPVEGAVVGSQKTAEKMRRDEDLGEMATISAVLYANTQHPELKQIFPNWNDRCKQIIKRWRSLSNEKKSPFLQHAKDNRSALRMRKAQQDQEKITFHQKTLKEQEQERIWKQHQAKAKEAMTATASFNNSAVNSFSSENNNMYSNSCILPSTSQSPAQTPISQQQQQHIQASFNTSLVSDSTVQYMPNVSVIPMQRGFSATMEPGPTPPNLLLEKGTDVAATTLTSEVDQKQLRTLLLKQQEFESSWLPPASANGQLTTHNQLMQHNAELVSPTCSSVLPQSIKHHQQQTIDIKSQHPAPVAHTPIPTKTKTPINIVLTHKIDAKARADTVGRNVPTTSTATNDCGDSIGTAELEKMDQDENVGFGDILGGFGEGDDEDFLKSLTADIGDDFNILEYGDPELDELPTSQNLLQKLDFDDNYKNA